MIEVADRTYKGFQIQQCQAAEPRSHGGKWVVRFYSHSGMMVFENQCPHFWRLSDAKNAIEHHLVYRDWP